MQTCEAPDLLTHGYLAESQLPSWHWQCGTVKILSQISAGASLADGWGPG
jgi:hypothetical protein